MLLIYSSKITTRITYIFKHLCSRILGIKIGFTSQIEEFISYSGPKLSYGKKPMGNEFFVQSQGLLTQQGFESFDITVREWEGVPCFFSVGNESKLPFDIFSASFYLLSRYEEYLPHVKDEKGRFLASESIAYKEGFLEQPVVDIWVYKFKETLKASFPELDFTSKKMIIHHLINAKQPFIYKNKGFLRSLSGYLNDLSKFKYKDIFQRTSTILGIKEDPYNTFDWIINSTNKIENQISVFFLIGEAVNFDEGFNIRRNIIKLLIKNVADYKEIGLVFSRENLKEFEQLKSEKEKIEAITNRNLQASMNDEYLVNLPENYRNLIELEIEKDYTLVYENTVGFRASTCTPFLFYDLDYEIVTPLFIHPIAFATTGFEGVNNTIKEEKITQFKSIVKKVNGTFSVVFTNSDFNISSENKIWRDLISK